MKKWILRITITAIILTGIYLLIMYKLGDRILNELIDQQISTMEEQFVSDNDEKSGNEYQQNHTDTHQYIDNGDNVPNNTVDTAPKPTKPKVQNKTKKGTPDTGNIQPKTESPKLAITKEKLESIKKKVTPADKISASNLILKRLTKQDIKELTAMVAKGLTPKDKERAKQIAYSRFTKDEIRTIMDLYAKYMTD